MALAGQQSNSSGSDNEQVAGSKSFKKDESSTASEAEAAPTAAQAAAAEPCSAADAPVANAAIDSTDSAAGAEAAASPSAKPGEFAADTCRCLLAGLSLSMQF